MHLNPIHSASASTCLGLHTFAIGATVAPSGYMARDGASLEVLDVARPNIGAVPVGAVAVGAWEVLLGAAAAAVLSLSLEVGLIAGSVLA